MPTIPELEARLLELAREMAEVEWRLKWARAAEAEQYPAVWNSPRLPRAPYDPPAYLTVGPRDPVFPPLAPMCGTPNDLHPHQS